MMQHSRRLQAEAKAKVKEYSKNPLRFGEIRSVVALRDLPADTELTSMYGKAVDNYTFIKQVFNDYKVYSELSGKEQTDYLKQMTVEYEVMLKNMLNFDTNKLFINKKSV